MPAIMPRPRVDLRMPGPNTTVAGNTAIFKLPVGRRYHELALVYAGITLAQMNEIRLLVNGKPVHRYTGTMRNIMNQFDGRADAATAGVLFIPLDRFDLKNRAGEEETAFNTGPGTPVRSLTLEIDMDAAALGTSFDLYANQSDNSPDWTGAFLHCLHYPRSVAGAGESEFSDLPYGGVTSQILNRAFIKPSAGTLSQVKIERDTYTLFERSAALNEAVQTDFGRVPQAGYYCLDRTERGYSADPIILRGAQDFRYKATFSAAAQVDFQLEFIGSLGD